MQWYTVGSISFPASWAAVAAAFLLPALYFLIRKEKAEADFIGHSFFIFFLAWKCSFVLFQFPMAVKNPLSVLYFNGGWKGYVLGMAGVFIYLFVQAKRRNVRAGLLAEAWIFAVLVYELVFYLLNRQHMIVTVIQLIGSILFLFWIRKKGGDITWRLQLLVLFACFQAFIYSLKGDLLSLEMATYAAGSTVIAVALQDERRGIRWTKEYSDWH